MTDKTKEELKTVLDMLKLTVIKNRVRVTVNKETNELYFITSMTYGEFQEFEGIKVDITKWGR